jgi:RNA polymerase sigma factor (sigma-70 family)
MSTLHKTGKKGYFPKKFQCHGGEHMDLQELQEVKQTCHRALVVAALQQHSALGLLMLYTHCERDVRCVVLRRLGVQGASDDVVQETFLRASERIDQLRDVHKLEAWVCAIAKNEAHKYLRQRQRLSTGAAVHEIADPETLVGEAKWHVVVEQASRGLIVRDRLFVELIVSTEFNWHEIAQQLNISLSNVYKLHRRVEERLAQACAALELATTHQYSCGGLCELLREWSGEYSPLWRKRITHHAQQCSTCGEAIKKTPAFRLGSF